MELPITQNGGALHSVLLRCWRVRPKSAREVFAVPQLRRPEAVPRRLAWHV